MVDHNIQMKKKNNGQWENLFPLTSSTNVIHSDGQTSDVKIKNNENAINNNLQDIRTLTETIGTKPTDPEWLNQSVFNSIKYLENYSRNNMIDVTLPPWNVPNDGITDATKSIKNVFENVSIRSTVYFPNGTYLITDQIVLDRELSIKGSTVGENGGTLFNFKIPSTSGEVIAFLIKSTAKNSNIENLYLKNSSPEGVSLQGFGNSADDDALTHFNVTDVWVVNFTNNFIFRKIYLSRFYRCVTRGGYRGFSLSGDSTSLVIEGCYAVGCTENWYLENIVYSTLISCASDDSERSAYRFVNCKGLHLSACAGETALHSGFFVDRDNIGITFSGCLTHRCGSSTSIKGTSLHVEKANKNIVVQGMVENTQSTDTTANSIIFGDAENCTVNSCKVITKIIAPPSVIVDGQRKGKTPPSTGVYKTGDMVYKEDFNGTGIYGWIRTSESSWVELTI